MERSVTLGAEVGGAVRIGEYYRAEQVAPASMVAGNHGRDGGGSLGAAAKSPPRKRLEITVEGLTVSASRLPAGTGRICLYSFACTANDGGDGVGGWSARNERPPPVAARARFLARQRPRVWYRATN